LKSNTHHVRQGIPPFILYKELNVIATLICIILDK